MGKSICIFVPDDLDEKLRDYKTRILAGGVSWGQLLRCLIEYADANGGLPALRRTLFKADESE